MSDLPDTLTIIPARPIEFAGQTYDRLDLREPTAGEMAQFLKLDGAESDILAISLIGGWPKGAVEKLGARDMLKAARFISGFLL